jgi:hypothetical protein
VGPGPLAVWRRFSKNMRGNFLDRKYLNLVDLIPATL